ncbi:MAG: DUF4426 domain-containing protein [Gammaproteobacteria bacterium]|nr:DUF4426 domain-containing protein [Gammaproteobacteria bacterium]MDH5802128.1 DUF4426 domain-containing protein [Gammaproteobacteria bacterium]
MTRLTKPISDCFIRVYSRTRCNTLVLTAILALLLCAPATAGTSQTFGDYTIHYSAFTSDLLQPNMAKMYKIVRSKNRAILSISIQKKALTPVGTPVKANVKVEATNLTGQLKNINIREVDEGAAVYYISEFHVAHEEILDFTLTATAKEFEKPLVVKFRQQFYTK